METAYAAKGITARTHVARADAKGARVIEINPAGEDFRAQPGRKLAPTLLLDVTSDMAAMQAFYEGVMGFALERTLGEDWIEYRIGANILALAHPRLALFARPVRIRPDPSVRRLEARRLHLRPLAEIHRMPARICVEDHSST